MAVLGSEELFVVTRGVDDQVELHVGAFSRPSTWWVRLGGPMSGQQQDKTTDRYVAAAVSSP
jgi:uncharacterized protein (UPF0548 family)